MWAVMTFVSSFLLGYSNKVLELLRSSFQNVRERIADINEQERDLLPERKSWNTSPIAVLNIEDFK